MAASKVTDAMKECFAPACTCERYESAFEANPAGHAVGCPRWGTQLPNTSGNRCMHETLAEATKTASYVCVDCGERFGYDFIEQQVERGEREDPRRVRARELAAQFGGAKPPAEVSSASPSKAEAAQLGDSLLAMSRVLERHSQSERKRLLRSLAILFDTGWL